VAAIDAIHSPTVERREFTTFKTAVPLQPHNGGKFVARAIIGSMFSASS
jgi:hypothetical protein